MRYSGDIIEEVRARNDIVDVISTYVNLKKSGSGYKGLCPFHNEKSPSFSVNQSKQYYHCFGCGAGGSVYTFLMQYENYTFTEALKYLADRAGIKLPEGEMTEEEKRKANLKQRMYDIYKDAAVYYYYQLYNSPKGKDAYKYLKDRQLSEEIIKKFGLGYSNVNGGLFAYLKSKGFNDGVLMQSGLFSMDEKRGAYDKFWNRVMFPIMDINNKVIGFGGRVMSDAKPKYLNSPETLLFDKSRNLFGMNIARSSRRKNLIICEGYMDVISLHQAGFDNAVASLGTALTGMQANLLKRFTDNILVTYDSDEAGRKAAMRAIPILRDAGLSVKVINMKPYKDPDEFIKNLGADEFQKRIDEAISGFFYETDTLHDLYDMNDPEQKTKFYNELAKKMLEFTQELERNNYITAVCQRYNIEQSGFVKAVNHYGALAIASGGIETKSYESEKKYKTKDKDESIKAIWRVLLSWYAEEQRLFTLLEGIIGADDFIDPVFHKAAEIMFKQHSEGKEVLVAQIINEFENVEEQNEAALLFSSNLKAVNNDEDVTDFRTIDASEKELYLNQLVRQVKLYSIDYKLRNTTDMEVLRQCTMEKANIMKLHIVL